MKRTVWIVFAVVLAAVIAAIVGLSFIGKKEKKSYEELRSQAVETTTETESQSKDKENMQETSKYETEETKENEAPAYEASMTIDHEKMKKLNSDYACWINIPGTDISYPVVLPEDNDFYLHRTFEKKYLYAGTLFIDAFSEKGLDQDNLIIYGHNMKNGTMFGTLKAFKNKEYFDSHPHIEIHTPNEVRVYQIFSVRNVSCDINTLNYKLDEFDKKEYIKNAIEESVQSRDVDEGQIVTLYTCTENKSKRLLVSGVRIH